MIHHKLINRARYMQALYTTTARNYLRHGRVMYIHPSIGEPDKDLAQRGAKRGSRVGDSIGFLICSKGNP